MRSEIIYSKRKNEWMKVTFLNVKRKKPRKKEEKFKAKKEGFKAQKAKKMKEKQINNSHWICFLFDLFDSFI